MTSSRFFMLGTCFFVGAAFAQPTHVPSTEFPTGKPLQIDQLPVSRLRERLEQLPPTARTNALRWLQGISFPNLDTDHMSADDDGAIFYIDEGVADSDVQTIDAVAASADTAAALSLAQTFALHSNPGAPNVIYVDFDGELLEGTAWNSTHASLLAQPYDTDNDPNGFSPSELAAIHEIWHRLAEDFAAFNVDVTTERPNRFNSTTGHILVTPDVDATGLNMPHAGAGGVAYVNVWGRSNYDYYSPALVYSDNLANAAHFIAEAASHEIGHNLGLSHDGDDSTAYFRGLGGDSDPSSWAPIMGVGYYKNVTQWSQGEYPAASNTQDDIAIITAKLDRVGDDHGDDRFAASLLSIAADGSISHTNPETDPDNLYADNKGIIHDTTDVDFFAMDVGDGSIDITVTPAWDAFTRTTRRGANLDIRIALYDGAGTLLESAAPDAETHATLQRNVTAGTYYLAVTGVGNPRIPYSDYGSMGMYFIAGQATAGEPNATPVAGDDAATTAEDTAVTIDVLANDTDPDGDTLSILSVTTPDSGNASISGSQIVYTPDADVFGTDAFTYTVGDGRGGLATAAVTVSVEGRNDAPAALDDTATTDIETAVTIDALANDYDPDGDPLMIDAVGTPGNGSAQLEGGQIVYTPGAQFTGDDTFTYQVTDGVANATATIVVSVNPPEPEPPATPTGLSASDNADGSATISWSAVADADFYDIQRETRHKKRDAWVGTTTLGSTADTQLVDAPGSGTARYRVRAGNGTGTSAWSSWSQVDITGGSGGGKGGNGKGRNKP